MAGLNIKPAHDESKAYIVGMRPSLVGLGRRNPGCAMTEPAMIDVTLTSAGDPLEFDVRVREGKGESRHHVTMAKETCARLAGGAHAPERVIEAAFRFLLDREPKEAILARFDVNAIARYFPEFERELPRYLERT
jgi:hypothetical protein